MIVYQIGGLFTGEAVFSVFTVIAAAALVVILYLLFRKNKYRNSMTGATLSSKKEEVNI